MGGGLLFFVGAILLVINFIMTWASRPSHYEVPVYSAPKLTGDFRDETAPASKLVAVTDSARWIDQWTKAFWHRRWERLPLTFTLWTIASVQPYTPLELAGRDIYVAEGCYNCHSQMIRPILSETKRYGDYSLPGEFVYDHPFQWGSRRIGPDLAREGGKQSNLWHLQHLENPQSINADSLMPEYSHLLSTKLNFKSIYQRVLAAKYLGAPYTSELEIANDGRTNAETLAIKQAERIAVDIATQGGPLGMEDKQIVALIAYMQRLGIDRYKPAPVVEPVPGSSPSKEPTEVAEQEKNPTVAANVETPQ